MGNSRREAVVQVAVGFEDEAMQLEALDGYIGDILSKGFCTGLVWEWMVGVLGQLSMWYENDGFVSVGTWGEGRELVYMLYVLHIFLMRYPQKVGTGVVSRQWETVSGGVVLIDNSLLRVFLETVLSRDGVMTGNDVSLRRMFLLAARHSRRRICGDGTDVVEGERDGRRVRRPLSLLVNEDVARGCRGGWDMVRVVVGDVDWSGLGGSGWVIFTQVVP